MDLSPDFLEALSNMMVNAIQAAATTAAANVTLPGTNQNAPGLYTNVAIKSSTFSMSEYRSNEELTVEDYFKRFDWALQLSKIPDNEHGNYARVHVGTELINALKFLVSPQSPEDLLYTDIKKMLIDHFDRTKNKYAESVKFRQLAQREEKQSRNSPFV